MTMVDQSTIEEFRRHLQQLEQEMSNPGVASDRKKYSKLAVEHARLTRLLAAADKVTALCRDIEEHNALMNDASADAELRELARDELGGLEAQLPTAESKLLAEIVPPDPSDSKNAIIEIRAGTGGEEAALFVGDLLRMYSKYAESREWKVGLMDASSSSIGGYKDVVFSVEGQDVYRVLKYESGGHRVQRIPVTEAQGRIHTSAATVAVFPEVDEDDDLAIPADELRVDIFCSSGPGGQSVNTTYSAVRITHLPTGIVAQSQDERSQHRNKDKAMRVLKARVLDHQRQVEAQRMANERRTLIGSGDRSQRIRTYNFPQNRVTDHRIGLTLHSLDRVMEGQMAQLLEALYLHDMQLKTEQGAAASGRRGQP
jgi:peptide chain release factor 1